MDKKLKKSESFFPKNKDKVLTKYQQQIIDLFVKTFGGVKIVEHGNIVQLLLNKNMVTMEGISYYWIESLKKEFEDLIIGLPEDKTSEYGMYIHLIKNK